MKLFLSLLLCFSVVSSEVCSMQSGDRQKQEQVRPNNRAITLVTAIGLIVAGVSWYSNGEGVCCPEGTTPNYCKHSVCGAQQIQSCQHPELGRVHPGYKQNGSCVVRK